MGAIPSTTDVPATTKLAGLLAQQKYLSDRIEPSRASIDYLPNKDLRDLLLLLCQGLEGRTLDYGSGGSPYRDLLPQCRPYVRADIPGDATLDLVLKDGLLPEEPSGSYDVILSTQVLEHVPESARYLDEAYRLLRPGGVLILTTHGMIPEHGCPYDFQRWTSDGLARAMTDAGFIVEENYKLTVDKRASLYLLSYAVLCVCISSGWRELFLRALRSLYRNVLIHLVNAVGDLLTEERLVRHGQPLQFRHYASLYVGVGIRARKPGASVS